MEIFNTIAENYGEYIAVIVAFILISEKIARLTPTNSDDKVLRAVYKVFAILGIKVPDVIGRTPVDEEKPK